MRRTPFGLLLLGLLAANPLTVFAQGPPAEEAAVEKVDLHWLGLIDAGNYQAAWSETASIAQRAPATEPSFASAIAQARAPLGSLKLRTLKASQATSSLPGLPDGHYFLLQYTTSFTHKAEATETVIASQEADGAWKVITYLLR